MRLLALALLHLILSSTVYANKLIWNIHDESKSTIAPSDRQTWSKALWKNSPPRAPKDQGLQKMIKEAETAYLKMEIGALSDQLPKIKKHLETAALSEDSYENFQQFYELKALKEYSLEGNLSQATQDEIQYFLQDPHFFKRMPTAVQKIKKDKITIKLSNLPTQAYVFGKGQNLLELSPGKYFIYFWKAPWIEAGWLEIKGKSSHFHRLNRYDASALVSAEDLKRRLEISRPASVKKHNVDVYRTSEGKEELIVQLSASIPGEIPRYIQSESFDSKTFDENEFDQTPSIERKSLLRSPWFWLAVGAAAVGGGFFVYHSTKGPNEVHTP